MPFPNVSADLAVRAHMYICYANNDGIKRLVKCQTFKVSMITSPDMFVEKWVMELPDISRNPFRIETLIDCDKLFVVDVVLPISLCTTSRRDICSALYGDIHAMLRSKAYSEYKISGTKIKMVNPAMG